MRRPRCDFPCTLAVATLAVIATSAAFASPQVRDALIADARIVHGQAWRAVTGALVHATWGHLVRDVALVMIAGIAYEEPLRRVRGWLYGAGLVVPTLAVLASGEARWYCGLSGLSHALLAAALTFEAMRRRGRVRLAVIVLGAIAALKPVYELATGSPVFAMALGPGIRQVPLAHVAGACVGIAAGLASHAPLMKRMRARPSAAAKRSTSTYLNGEEASR